MRKNARMAIFFVAAVGLLVAPLAFGSNMGFKLERNLDAVPGGLSYYVASFPFYRSFQDLWHTANRAFGQDGITQSDDVLADWFTNGDGVCDGTECTGSFSMLKFNNDTASPAFNRWDGQTIAKNPLGNVVISGTAYDITNTADPGRGYLVQVLSGQFPVIIVGSENPDVTVYDMAYVAGALNYFPFSHLYHSTYVTSADLLNAIPDPDWEKGVSILYFQNNSTDAQFNRWVGQTVTKNPLGNKVVSGTPFNLVPGDGYLFQLPSAPTDGTVTIPLPHY